MDHVAKMLQNVGVLQRGDSEGLVRAPGSLRGRVVAASDGGRTVQGSDVRAEPSASGGARRLSQPGNGRASLRQQDLGASAAFPAATSRTALECEKIFPD